MSVFIAKIALSAATFAIDRPYDYLVPPQLTELRAGMRVIVPFGAGNRRTEGLVLAISEQSEPDKPLKSVLTQLDEESVLDAEGLKLALWVRERWFCTVYDAARAMLPAGLYYSLQDCYTLADGVDRDAALAAAGKSKAEGQVAELIANRVGGMEIGQLREAFGTRDPAPALRSLVH